MSLIRTVQESNLIEDGKHAGTIKKVDARTYGEFNYVDIVLGDIDGVVSDFTLKYSAPDNLSPNTKLGKLIAVFGGSLKVGSSVDLESIFRVGSKVEFMTLKRQSKKDPSREYAEIVEDSLKPSKLAVKSASSLPVPVVPNPMAGMSADDSKEFFRKQAERKSWGLDS